MSDVKVSIAPGFFLSKELTGTEPNFNYAEWAKPPVPEEILVPDPVAEIACPACPRAPMLSKERDTSPRDGRLTCYICGWKA